MADLSSTALAFVGVGIILGFGLLILSKVKTEVTAEAGADSLAENATEDAEEAMGNFSGWLPLLAIVIVAGIILWYVRSSMGGTQGGSL